jgi:hypothetical protein
MAFTTVFYPLPFREYRGGELGSDIALGKGNGPGGNRRKDHPRPVQYTQEMAELYLQRMRDGESCLAISRELSMPSTDTIWHWNHGRKGAPPTFCDEYAKARKAQADMFAGQVLEIADAMDQRVHDAMVAALEALPEDASDAEKRKAVFFAKKRSTDAAKEQISARKWTAGRMHPSNWGDRMALQHETDPTNPPTINFSNLTDEQLEKLAAMEEELGGGTGS